MDTAKEPQLHIAGSKWHQTIVEMIMNHRFGLVTDVVLAIGHKTPIDLESFIRDNIEAFT